MHLIGALKFVAAVLLVAGIAGAQDAVVNSPTYLKLPTATQLQFAAGFTVDVPADLSAGVSPPLGGTTVPTERVRRITLEQVKQSANRAVSVPARMGQLSVEAAKQRRLGVQADYFPKFGASAGNLHYTDFLGQLVTVRRPLLGTTAQVVVPIFSQNQTFALLTFTQPITPLFQVHQAVKIARADERIAMARAASPIAKMEREREVEKTYFKLLIAQRELTLAEAKLKGKSYASLHAGAAIGLVRAPDQDLELVEAKKAVEKTSVEVRQLSVSLNNAMGWPEETELELVMPDPLVENISLTDVSDQSFAANPEVVTAQETVVKARAASTLSKLAYVPTVAATAGYLFQNVIPAVPSNFGYGGVIASYNLFDFGKREHAVKEARIQLELAELGLQATKAKAAGELKKSYFELEHARQVSQVAQRMGSSLALVMNASSTGENNELKVARAAAELEILEADLAHRQAFARVTALMSEQREHGRPENIRLLNRPSH